MLLRPFTLAPMSPAPISRCSAPEVVFHVNTRNDDNDLFQEAMREAHEQEIAQATTGLASKYLQITRAREFIFQFQTCRVYTGETCNFDGEHAA